MRRRILTTAKIITQAFSEAVGFCVLNKTPIMVMGAYILLAGILFYPVLKSGLFMSYDFLAGVYPPNEVFRTGFLSWYTPYIYGGVNVMPLHLFQPIMFLVHWLAPATHNNIILIFVHICLAGIGMFLFLRKYGERGAAFGGMAYMFTGMICSLVFAGHEGKIMVSAYLPWLMWCIDNITDTGKWRWSIVAGVIAGMAINTFHIQMSYYVIIFCIVYYLFRITKKSIPLIIVSLLISGVMFTPLYLASKKVVASSTRSLGRNYQKAISYSMPPEEIFCIAESGLQGERWNYRGRREIKQHTEYMGWLVVLFMGIGIFIKSKLRWPMMAIGATSLIFAFGGYTPLYELIYKIPPNGMFRSPGMAFIGFAFAGCALAGSFIKSKWPWLLVVAIGLFTFWDIAIVEKKYIKPITFNEAYGNTADVIEFIRKQPGDFRVWPIEPQINDNRWGYYKIKSIGGNYPMPRTAFVDSVGRRPEGILPDYHLMTFTKLREMNVKYLITIPGEPNIRCGIDPCKLVFSGKYFLVYEIL